MDIRRIAVVGGGSWGTALALMLASKEYDINLWVYEQDLVETMRKERENTRYLPGFRLPSNIHPSSSFEEVLSETQFIVWVTPSHTIRTTYPQALPYMQPGSILVGAGKGIENTTLLRPSQIIGQLTPPAKNTRIFTLSGPTFAKEVADGQPSTAVVAGPDDSTGKIIQEAFNTERFRVYFNYDQIGVELGGALKNVIAIAAGIAAGLKLGSNSRAALITRGLWEITRLGRIMGANPLTFLGLSGMGDLVLTCDGTQSRNFHVGKRIGLGEKLDKIQSSMQMVAEGVKTTRSARELATRHNVEMPITEQIFQVLYNDKDPRTALRDLMTRRLKSEHQFDYMEGSEIQ